MDDAQRELLRYLFAMATALIEAAHETAVTGQSAEMAAADYAAAARRLQVVARDITALADAATVIAMRTRTTPIIWPNRLDFTGKASIAW